MKVLFSAYFFQNAKLINCAFSEEVGLTMYRFSRKQNKAMSWNERAGNTQRKTLIIFEAQYTTSKYFDNIKIEFGA